MRYGNVINVYIKYYRNKIGYVPLKTKREFVKKTEKG